LFPDFTLFDFLLFSRF